MSPDQYAELLAAIPDGPEAEELRRQLMKEQTEEEDRLRREENARILAEYNRRVAAVLETAYAMHRRGKYFQYDSVALTYAKTRRGEPGCRRATDEVSPEDATANTPKYIVCSSFIYNAYFDAIGWRFCGQPDNCTTMCPTMTAWSTAGMTTKASPYPKPFPISSSFCGPVISSPPVRKPSILFCT